MFNKTLNDSGPVGNSECSFPSTSMFPSASPWETLRVSGKQNWGQSLCVYCFVASRLSLNKMSTVIG